MYGLGEHERGRVRFACEMVQTLQLRIGDREDRRQGPGSKSTHWIMLKIGDDHYEWHITCLIPGVNAGDSHSLRMFVVL